MARLVKDSLTSISMPSFSPIIKRKMKRERANSDPRPCIAPEKDENANDLTVATLLSYSVKYGDVDIVEELLKCGCDPNQGGINRENPLHEAVSQSDLKMMQLLIKYGADVNVKNEHGQTPVQRAVSLDDVKSLRLLHEAGATVNDADAAGRTLLDIALQESNESVCLYLMQNGLDARAINKYKEAHLKSSQFSSKIVNTLSDFAKRVKETKYKERSQPVQEGPIQNTIFKSSSSDKLKNSILRKFLKKDHYVRSRSKSDPVQLETEIPFFRVLEIR